MVSAPLVPRGASTAQPLNTLLARATHRVARHVESTLAGTGISLEQWRVLDLLAGGEGHSMSEIAEHAMVPAPTLTKIVDRLVDNALVHRRVDARDRRRVLVFTTDHGADLHTRLAPQVGKAENDAMSELEPDDAAQLIELLTSVAARPAPTGDG
ncbi:MarR family transcriptional regulator [Pseudonocardia sp.]|uniref:MarR family winged helix-turn-helix transcriptional regulator n=1 Tax=Pseudonocardia sp. TaxID=60912 RepID=UPI0031FC557F